MGYDFRDKWKLDQQGMYGDGRIMPAPYLTQSPVIQAGDGRLQPPDPFLDDWRMTEEKLGLYRQALDTFVAAEKPSGMPVSYIPADLAGSMGGWSTIRYDAGQSGPSSSYGMPAEAYRALGDGATYNSSGWESQNGSFGWESPVPNDALAQLPEWRSLSAPFGRRTGEAGSGSFDFSSDAVPAGTQKRFDEGMRTFPPDESDTGGWVPLTDTSLDDEESELNRKREDYKRRILKAATEAALEVIKRELDLETGWDTASLSDLIEKRRAELIALWEMEAIIGRMQNASTKEELEKELTSALDSFPELAGMKTAISQPIPGQETVEEKIMLAYMDKQNAFGQEEQNGQLVKEYQGYDVKGAETANTQSLERAAGEYGLEGMLSKAKSAYDAAMARLAQEKLGLEYDLYLPGQTGAWYEVNRLKMESLNSHIAWVEKNYAEKVESIRKGFAQYVLDQGIQEYDTSEYAMLAGLYSDFAPRQGETYQQWAERVRASYNGMLNDARNDLEALKTIGDDQAAAGAENRIKQIQYVLDEVEYQKYYADPDFDEKVQGAKRNSESIRNRYEQVREMFDDIGGVGDYVLEGYDLLFRPSNTDYLDMFYYIHTELGLEEAMEYARHLLPVLREKMYYEEKADAAGYARKEPVWASLQSIPGQLSGTFQAVGQTIGNAILNDNGNKGYVTQGRVNAERGAVSDLIGNPAGKFFYNTGMGAADLVATLPAGFAAPFLMAGNTVSRTAVDNYERGVPPGETLVASGLMGALEFATEKIGLDRLFGLWKNPAAHGFMKTALMNGFPEALEGVPGSVAGPPIDRLLAGDLSAAEDEYQALLTSGTPMPEAEQIILRKYFSDIAQNAASDYVSGALVTAGGMAAHAAGGKLMGSGGTPGMWNKRNAQAGDPFLAPAQGPLFKTRDYLDAFNELRAANGLPPLEAEDTSIYREALETWEAGEPVDATTDTSQDAGDRDAETLSEDWRQAQIRTDQNGKPIITGAKKYLTPNQERKRRDKHADSYYDAVRNRKYDAIRIANSTNWDASVIEDIRQHVFVTTHTIDGVTVKFASDYQQAEAWQRLMEGGEKILPSDIVFLQHEYLELTLMRDQGLSYDEAHALANKQYNWYNLVKAWEVDE